jgi:RPA family protein
MTGREPAWRIFAREFVASTEEERASSERAASYVFTPLGARVNRVLLAGILSPAEMIGKSEEVPFYRARLSDPTGQVVVTAGGFQPRAMSKLQRVDGPQPALVMGKAHLFRGRDGAAYPSVRAEAIRPLTAEEYRGHLAEILEQSSRRWDLVKRLNGNASEEELLGAGFPLQWIQAATEARKRYPEVNLETYRSGLRAVSEVIRAPSLSPAESVPVAPGIVTVTKASPPPPLSPPTVSQRAQESAFLELLDELSEGSVDGYANLKDAVTLARSRGISEAATEELLNRLEESGAIEEPIVGKLRRA